MKLGRIAAVISAHSSLSKSTLYSVAALPDKVPEEGLIVLEQNENMTFIRFVKIDGEVHELFPSFRIMDGEQQRVFATPGYLHELTVFTCFKTGRISTKLRTIETLSGEEVYVKGELQLESRIVNANRRSKEQH